MKYIIYRDSKQVAIFDDEYDCDVCLLTLKEESPGAHFVKAVGE